MLLIASERIVLDKPIQLRRLRGSRNVVLPPEPVVQLKSKSVYDSRPPSGPQRPCLRAPITFGKSVGIVTPRSPLVLRRGRRTRQ